MCNHHAARLLGGIRFLLVAVLAAAPGMAADYKLEYRLSTVLGEAFPWGWSGKRWAELVAEKTSGRIHIKLYPGASLVSDDQTKEFTALRQGTIDLAIGSTINWSPRIKELNLFALSDTGLQGHRCADPGRDRQGIR